MHVEEALVPRLPHVSDAGVGLRMGLVAATTPARPARHAALSLLFPSQQTQLFWTSYSSDFFLVFPACLIFILHTPPCVMALHAGGGRWGELAYGAAFL